MRDWTKVLLKLYGTAVTVCVLSMVAWAGLDYRALVVADAIAIGILLGLGVLTVIWIL